MVGDRPFGSRNKRAKLQRRSSWKDTLRGFASVNDKEERERPRSATVSPSSSRHSLRRRTLHTVQPPAFIKEKGNRNITDTDSEPEENEDYSQRREEDRPLQARVKYVYPQLSTWLETGSEKQQQELSAAVVEADSKAVRAMTREDKKDKEPIGVRLTMTSRTGYFQDRVISPSMVSFVLRSLFQYQC